MRIGILGGSFNPPHFGHLRLAEAALASGRVDGILFVPAAEPPHKKTPVEADAATRLDMTRLLAADDPRLAVDGLELERTGPSFTIDTVHELLERNPANSYRLVIGSDMARMFAKWRDYRELLRLVPPLVAERPDAKLEGSPGMLYPGLLEDERAVLLAGRFAMPLVAINSTLIRERIRNGAAVGDIADLTPPGVLEYIRAHRLYGLTE